MKILFFNWKDIMHPRAGGAEIVTHEVMKRFVQDGNFVVLITAEYTGCKKKETIDGVKIIRKGRGIFHYFFAVNFYIKNFKGKFDVIVEEVNTIPYFLNLFNKQEKTFLFYHQLAEKVWFYQVIFPLSLLGYILEYIYTWLQGKINKLSVITVSNSTKKDLLRYGFNDDIKIIREGIGNMCIDKIDLNKKNSKFTVLFFSSLRSMKRPLEAIKAFYYFYDNLKINEKSNVKMIVGGSGSELQHCRNFVIKHGINHNVDFLGKISDDEKISIMQKSSVLVSTSVKEGWGLIVTEANSQGTPAISYDVDGLRDSTNFGNGFIVNEKYTVMGKKIFDLYDIFINNKSLYRKMCNNALQSAKEINFDNCYSDFKKIIDI